MLVPPFLLCSPDDRGVESSGKERGEVADEVFSTGTRRQCLLVRFKGFVTGNKSRMTRVRQEGAV